MRGIAVLLAVLALTTACGAGEETPEEALAAAAERMEKEDSAAFTFTAMMESRDLTDQPIPFSGEGSATFEDESTGSMDMDLARMFELIIAEEAETPEQRELLEQLFGDPSGWRAEIRFFGDESYMRIPALTDLIGGEPWVEFEESSEPESGLDVVFGDSPNPSAFLRYLDATAEVEEVGTERVGGRSTTRYRATVDLRRMAEQSPEEREHIERVIEETGKDTVPIEAWVDEQGLIRRIKFEDVSPPEEDERYPTSFVMTMDIAEYGVEVEVERPPSDQVMSEAEFDELTE